MVLRLFAYCVSLETLTRYKIKKTGEGDYAGCSMAIFGNSEHKIKKAVDDDYLCLCVHYWYFSATVDCFADGHAVFIECTKFRSIERMVEVERLYGSSSIWFDTILAVKKVVLVSRVNECT